MRYGLQWILSLIFNIQMYLVMAIMALVFTPWAIIDRRGAFAAVHTYCRWVRFSARWIIGLRSEIRGEVPTDEVIVASKHQSFFDIIMIVSVAPRPKFIMKKELRWVPIVGFYGWRIGCVAVDRGKRGKAIKQMLDGVRNYRHLAGQLIIFPQGTRVAPGAEKPYKVGVGLLYSQLGQDCVPTATNVGVFWPRHAVYRERGLAVVEFLPRIKPGMKTDAFLQKLEDDVESASDRLMAEAGFGGK